MTQDPNWTEPISKLAPGVVLKPSPAAPPRLESEQVDHAASTNVEELQGRLRRLEHDNQILMNQIEEAWAVIKARDREIENLRENAGKPWAQ